MTNPKRKLRGMPALGKAIDERIRTQGSAGLTPQGIGAAPPSTISGGGSTGGSSAGGSSADLTVVHTQSFPAVGGTAASPQILLAYASSLFPASASLATVSASAGQSTSTTTHTPWILLEDSYLRLSWTSTESGGAITAGSKAMVAQAIRKAGDQCILQARIRVNDKDRLKRISLTISDHSLNIEKSGDLLPSLSDNAWHEVEYGGIDVSAFDDFMRIGVTAQGTDSAANVGLTQLDVELLEVRMW